MDKAAQPGRPAVVESQGQALVLEHEPVMRCHGGRELAAYPIELLSGKRVSGNPSGGVAALDAVLSGRRQSEIGRQPVDVRDRATADQGHRAARGPIQLVDELPAAGAEACADRGVREVDEGPVDVEEVGPVGSGCRRRCGTSRPPAMSMIARRHHLPRPAWYAPEWRPPPDRTGVAARCSNRPWRLMPAASINMRPAQRYTLNP